VIVIEDLNKGGMSVTNNVENVVPYVHDLLDLDVENSIVIYRDSDGIYDGIDLKSTSFPFYFLGENNPIKSEDEAVRIALAMRGKEGR